MKSTFCFLITCMCFFLVTFSSAQTRILIKVKSQTGVIEGESIIDGYKNAIEAQAFSESDQSCAVEPGPIPAPCRALTGPWNFSMGMEKSVIDFKREFYLGQPLASIDISFVRPSDGGFQKFYEVHMENAYITTISESGAGDVPQFYIVLDPAIIKWTYFKTDDQGQTIPFSFGWDRVLAQPL